jgi:hypothetical protein
MYVVPFYLEVVVFNFVFSFPRPLTNFQTLVFICDVRATKNQIKAAVKALYNIPAISVNTLVR